MGRQQRRRPGGVLLALGVLALVGTVMSGALADPPPGLPPAKVLNASRANFLRLAETGVQRINRDWWNPQTRWYNERLAGPNDGKASIWTTVHLFNTLEGIAVASPTPAHMQQLRWFTDRSYREYWNPVAGHIRHTREHVGGFSPSSKVTGPTAHVYYDDNGWLGLAYLDAYRITHTQRYLTYADDAFQFTAKTGWADGAGGGVWWDTKHTSRSSEGITTNTLLGALLYETTRNPTYLRTTEKYISWADAHIWDSQHGLYMRDVTSPILMRYVQSPMIAAFESLCRSTKDDHWCDKAENLANDVLNVFPAAANMGPQYDEVFLRWMLDLYHFDHDKRWYELAYYNAQRVQSNAASGKGLFLHNWDGGRGPDAPPDSLKFEASALSVFAWVAAAQPPAG